MFCSPTTTKEADHAAAAAASSGDSIQGNTFPYLYDMRSDCATTTTNTKGKREVNDDEEGRSDVTGGEKVYLQRPNVQCDCCLKCY